MKLYTLTSTQHLPVSREEAWNFLSNPAQLENITADNMSLTPLEPLPQAMYEGMIIHYQIRPFLGIKLNWVTEITHIDEGQMFVDEQRFGPFRFWHHEHRLVEKGNGTEMQDIVHYAMPFSLLGCIAHVVFVRSMLENMFKYRKSVMKDIFS